MKIIAFIIIFIKNFIFNNGDLSLDLRLSLLAKTPVLRSKVSNPILENCGGYVTLGWGGILPVIILRRGEVVLPAFWHEVGHVPDITSMTRAMPLIQRALSLVIHTMYGPLHASAWAVKFYMWLAGPATQAGIVIDLDLEVRADAFAVRKVGAHELHSCLCGVAAAMFSCPLEDIESFLETHKENDYIAVLRKRLDILKAQM